MTLVKADLGIKRICPSCSARFYDLQKRPIECPKCAVTFEPESLYKQRRPRQPEPEKAVVVTRERDEEEEEVEETEELEAAEDETAADETAPLETADDEVVAEEETETTGMSVVEPDAENAEIADIEEEDIAEEDAGHSALLEEVEEEEDDVSNIIDADLDKDER